MKKQPSPLSRPLFLAALFLLLLNDFVLKPNFPGAVTGKLSDITGVFTLTVFGLALLPRYRLRVAAGSALWFVYWKSPLSQTLIDCFNGLALYPIQRVVDYSDLWALLSIPAALLFVPRDAPPIHVLHPVKRVAIPLLCLFAFCATSRAHRYGFISQGVPVDASKRWTTHYSTPQLDSLFKQAAKEVITDSLTGDRLLSEVVISDYITFDVQLQVTDTGKKRRIWIKGYYVCYYPEYNVNIREGSLNRMFYKKLDSYLAPQKPL